MIFLANRNCGNCGAIIPSLDYFNKKICGNCGEIHRGELK